MASPSLVWLPLDLTLAAAQAAAAQGVSDVARSPGQFLDQYQQAQGDPHRLSPYWRRRRDAFVARHRAQLLKADAHPSGWDASGQPTRRHLALAVWAWSPSPRRLRRWLGQRSQPNPNPILAAWAELEAQCLAGALRWPELIIDPAPGQASARAHAWCEPGGRCTVRVAPKLAQRAKLSILGVLAHEVGHAYLMQEGAEHSERDADEAARLLFGRRIRYDADDVQTWGRGVSPRPGHLPR